ncbi:hypothetical protein MBM_05546 [Drepanopeziza brunnea f. sp. 'multigermtubi' MB_m1]|uniref:Uncharacterized protein n=1 Tax=Marssonina brunnea f. sp. multigermtubi (strain MB_m1) TaxID=1072389 RepID=K1WUY4_MARBU|nr:uncharacterized protein MBM_05546 [Drepanopeziza brunnea f. sp. 'multigermtubi' MB_m1]EKD16252.1 hypothetical protein MBM_05546 [Drepanopeziza brunnea f. sp. 'multigermtubi' MB_m1]
MADEGGVFQIVVGSQKRGLSKAESFQTRARGLLLFHSSSRLQVAGRVECGAIACSQISFL